jgi:TolB protein
LSRNGNDYRNFIVKPDGTSHREVTGFLTGSPVTWSPDETMFAFKFVKDDFFDLYIVNTDGTNLLQLTDEIWHVQNFAWSPDGKRLVIGSVDNKFRNEIHLVNADGSNLIQLTENDWSDESPIWSPDGSKIAFRSDPERVDKFQVYLMNPDGSDLQQITEIEGGVDFCGWVP